MTKQEAIMKAKVIINGANLSSVSIDDIVKFLAEHPMRKNAKIGAAIRWTLACGVFVRRGESNWKFYMPKTRVVLDSWHGKRIPGRLNFAFFESDFDEEFYDYDD